MYTIKIGLFYLCYQILAKLSLFTSLHNKTANILHLQPFNLLLLFSSNTLFALDSLIYRISPIGEPIPNTQYGEKVWSQPEKERGRKGMPSSYGRDNLGI